MRPAEAEDQEVVEGAEVKAQAVVMEVTAVVEAVAEDT